jgi:hypothetical protein
MRVIDASKRTEAERGLRIPADFTQNVLNKKQSNIEFFQVEGSSEESAFLIELRVLRAVIAMNSHLLELASRSSATNPINEADLKSVAKKENPVALKAEFAGRDPIPAGFNQSLPGTLVMFLMMNLLTFGGASIAGERTNGVLRRLRFIRFANGNWSSAKSMGDFCSVVCRSSFFSLLGNSSSASTSDATSAVCSSRSVCIRGSPLRSAS